MNMDFEQLLKQEVQKAARQDYEEITAKAQDYPYKFSKEFNEKMKGIIREEKKKAKKKAKQDKSQIGQCSRFFEARCRTSLPTHTLSGFLRTQGNAGNQWVKMNH